MTVAMGPRLCAAHALQLLAGIVAAWRLDAVVWGLQTGMHRCWQLCRLAMLLLLLWDVHG